MLAARDLNVSNDALTQEFEQLFHDQYPLVYRTAYSVTVPGRRRGCGADNLSAPVPQRRVVPSEAESESITVSRCREHRYQRRSFAAASTF
jgi:hypothetical protein